LGVVHRSQDYLVIAFPVSAKKAEVLRAKMDALGCYEKDLEENLLHGSAITILHRPTGIKVRCNRERSQALNRFFARRLLVEELEARAQNKTRHQVKADHLREKKRRVKRPGACPGGQPLPGTVSPAVRVLLRQWQTNNEQNEAAREDDEDKSC
jgi:peptide chain release factor